MAMRTKRHREAARRGAAVPRHSRTIPNGKEGQTCFPIRNGNQGLTFFPIRSETFVQTFRLIVAWDPTEPVATRPLVLQRQGGWNFFYTHDGNKNVSDVVSFQQARGVPAHYEYAPFGAVTAATTNTAFTAFNVAETNPYRFSSEYADDTLGLVYYNYRHYNPVDGRWLRRDCLEESIGFGLYLYINNQSGLYYDVLGLASVTINQKPQNNSYPSTLELEVTPRDIKEGCELNFIQLAFDTYLERWKVDANNAPLMPQTFGPYYVDWQDTNLPPDFDREDGTRIFYDRPTVQTYFYLFIVESCCVEKYKDSENCNCCLKSQATVIDRVYWTTKKGVAKRQKISDSIKGKMDKKLDDLVNGKSFKVHCDQYQEDYRHDGDKANGIDMEVKIDYGK